MILRTIKLNVNRDSRSAAMQCVWCLDLVLDHVLAYNRGFSYQVVR